MGQRLSLIEPSTFEYDAKEYEFFTVIQEESVMSLIQHARMSPLLVKDKKNHDDKDSIPRISWVNYFKILTEIKEKIVEDLALEEKRSWHPATHDYSMERIELEPVAYRQVLSSSEESSAEAEPMPDDYTDDEADAEALDDGGKPMIRPKRMSEEEYGEQERVKEEIDQQSSVYEEYRPGWDPQVVSPVFFGYKATSMVNLSALKDSSAAEQESAEERALKRAREVKVVGKESLEKKLLMQKALREKKIEELKSKYAISATKRNEELLRNKDILNPSAYKLFGLEWAKTKTEADRAFKVELDRMTSMHEAQLAYDHAELKRLAADTALFDDAIGSQRPTAALIEDISKIEVRKWTDELYRKCSEMAMVRDEYTNLKNSLVGRRAGKNADAGIDERSMASISLTRLKECQKEVQMALQCIDDAEVLLRRSIRVKEQEMRLLPLFKAVTDSEEDYPSSCPFSKLLCAIILVSSGTFDQRMDLLLHVFQPQSSEYSRHFMLMLLASVGEVMNKLKLLPFRLPSDELNGLVSRAFIDLNIRQTSMLTRLEVKDFFKSLISRNRFLSDFFGVDRDSLFSAYQRSIMHPLALLSYGILDKSACKHLLHYQMTRYHPELNSERKILVHDLAMNIGVDDPIRVDYRQLIRKNAHGSNSYMNVEALYHGHLMNVKYVETNDRSNAAIKIQSIVRSFRERRFADSAAKSQAFDDAKALAIQEVKNRLIAEFREREASSGMARMKWDAQVRLKQGKIRSTGQAVSRSETVMLMMEEAVQRAIEDIEIKSKELQKTDEYSRGDFQVKDLVIDDPSLTRDIAELFGIAHWFENPDLEEIELEIETPRPSEDRDDDGAVAVVSRRDQMLRLPSQIIVESLEGTYVYHPSQKGENRLQRDLRIAMAFPSPEGSHLLSRLRAIDSVFTLFKVGKFLSEVPSKRLLLLMVDHLSLEQLALQLENHFKLARNHMHIASTLKRIAETDMEMGVYPLEVIQIQHTSELALHQLVYSGGLLEVQEANKRIETRIATSESTTDKVAIEEEITHSEGMLRKVLHSCDEVSHEVDTLKKHFKTLQLSLKELERKNIALQNLPAFRAGDDLSFEAKNFDRMMWLLRMANAENLPEITYDDQDKKFKEICIICKDFIETACADAMTIVKELYLPNIEKSIPVHDDEEVDGRSDVCGRGRDGKKETFEAHNISYRVCLDDDGVFNGSDECAAKAAGNDRLFSLQYSKCQVKGLHAPLVATVDYFGFRVLATSVLPTTNITFTAIGEIRKSSEELLHGVINHGDTFVNKNRILQTLLQETSEQLNLSEHIAKGFKDMGGQKTHCSAVIKIYKGINGDFYMKDFWTAFPPEIPEFTPHLPRSPRDQSVFWRRLRPEFCYTFSAPLSPDAASTIVYHAVDQDSQYNTVSNATAQLVNKNIEEFVEHLSIRTFHIPLADGLGLNISSEMHIRGINLRHMGLVRSLMWRQLPGAVSIFNHEKFIRTSYDVRFEIKNNSKVSLNDMVFTVLETTKNKISHFRIPIDRTYNGISIRATVARCGTASSEKNSWELRCLFLCEMVVRVIKQLIRNYLRHYTRKTEGTSSSFMVSVLCEFLNILSGSSDHAERVLSELVYEGIRERYGSSAVTPSERNTLTSDLKNCIPYSVKRLLSSFNVKLSLLCMIEFCARPIGFLFSTSDIMSVSPIVRHNVSVLPYSEAMLAKLKAFEAERNTFIDHVISDGALVFFPLYERKGSRTASNIGVLGNSIRGSYSKGCMMYLPGPIVGDSFSKCVGFDLESKPYVEIKYSEKLVSENPNAHFSIGIFAKCTQTKEIKRVAVMSGRFGLVVSRENYWSFVYILGAHEVTLRISKCNWDKFEYIVCTFDGTTVRCYVDSELRASIEVETLLQAKLVAAKKRVHDQYANMDQNEKEERALKKGEAQVEAESFFSSRDGTLYLSSTTTAIMESAEFIKEHLDVLSDKRQTSAQLRMEATARAKQKYTTDLYLSKVQKVAEQYFRLRDELKQRVNADDENTLVITRRPILLGSDGEPNEKLSVGNSSFVGCLSCFAVYNECLTSDRIRRHYLSAVLDKTLDASRLFNVAASKFEEALRYTNDATVIRGYAQSICGYLKMDKSNKNLSSAVSLGKDKVLSVIEDFKQRQNADAIAEILKAIPQSAEYSDLVCSAFNAIRYVDKGYFVKSKIVTRVDLKHIPKIFFLDELSSPKEHLQTAALIYQEVVQEHSLQRIYGEVDLQWIPTLESPELVIALVKHAMEDMSLNFIVAGKLFQQNINDENDISDHDVQLLAHHLPLTVGYDLTGCINITSLSLKEIVRNRAVVAINLDGCVNIDNESITILLVIAKQLELLSFVGLKKLTDDGVVPLVSACSFLSSLNLNNCSQLTQKCLLYAAQSNKSLSTLHASCVYMSNEGLLSLCSLLSPLELLSFDISFCRDITDVSIIHMAETFRKLQFLNVCGLSRVTGKGLRAICEYCWNLRSLNFEDLFLLNDSAFLFSHLDDNRKELLMLKELTTINVRDCPNLTDNGFFGIIDRCRSVQELYIRGCDKISDKTLSNMTNLLRHPTLAFCDHLVTLDVSFCQRITSSGILFLIAKCPNLECLNVSGIPTINDEFIRELCKVCTTIVKLTVQRCMLLSDVALCCIASSLWIELLDLSYCSKITDEGLQVLFGACNGIECLRLKKLSKLTSKSLDCIHDHLKLLKLLDVSETQSLSGPSLKALSQRGVKIIQ